MYQWLSVVSFAPLAVLSVSACEASQVDGGAMVGRQAAADNPGTNVINQQAPINQRFRSLDEYLAHLQRTQGPIGKPWYEEVRPGIYKLQTGNLRPLGPDDEKRSFTREELERKFGFAK